MPSALGGQKRRCRSTHSAVAGYFPIHDGTLWSLVSPWDRREIPAGSGFSRLKAHAGGREWLTFSGEEYVDAISKSA